MNGVTDLGGLSQLNRMKIGFLVSSVSREAGGMFQSVRGLAKAVVSTGTTASVFGISDEQSAADLQQWQPLSVQTFRPQFRAWGYSNQLGTALLGADLDILSTHGLWKYCSVASRRWHERTGRPYIVHPEGMLESWALQNAKWKKRSAGLLYEDRHLGGAACLRALCEAEAQSIRAYGVRNPICVIPNGVDLPDLSETPTPQPQAFAEGRKVLLYLGRLHPKKNVANLIRAWKQVLDSNSAARASWVLAIAGWSQRGYETQLRQLTTDLGLLNSVIFLGPRFGTEKNECYRACAAFSMPSLSEGLPITVLEAWAYAKPVLITPQCNLSEGFAAGAALQIGTGPNEIAAGLKQVIEMSDDDRRAMGNHGRNLAERKFSWPRIGEQMCSVYEWALGVGPRPECVSFD